MNSNNTAHDNKAWYLLHCKAKQEDRAQLNIENQGYSTYLPKIAGQKILHGKRIECLEPLFPNYIFIQLDDSTANFNALRSTRGVKGFVRFGDGPAKIPDHVMQGIIAIEQHGQQDHAPQPVFKVGEKVQITEGPFAGFHAIYAITKGEERCLVFLDMLGQQQRIEIKEAALRHE